MTSETMTDSKGKVSKWIEVEMEVQHKQGQINAMKADCRELIVELHHLKTTACIMTFRSKWERCRSSRLKQWWIWSIKWQWVAANKMKVKWVDLWSCKKLKWTMRPECSESTCRNSWKTCKPCSLRKLTAQDLTKAVLSVLEVMVSR